MASVPLKFIPPDEPGWTTLHIYEATTSLGPFTEIENVPSGDPNYITRWTTDKATAVDNWFQINWSDSKDAFTETSQSVKGGTETLVGEIVQRILLRDSTINENIAAQEAAAAISDYFRVDDPYTIDPASVNPKILQGLTLLAMAWGYTVTQATSGSVQKFTAGLVSLDTGTSSTKSSANIDQLIKLANKLLGRNYSLIMRLKEISVAGGYRPLLVTADLSRTMIEI